MRESYDDITSRIEEEPTWWDSNGTPRYGEFDPWRCPDIYSRAVWLYRIACQACGRYFNVEGHQSYWSPAGKAPMPRHSHYGDPPIHGCVGDTMNCDDIYVLQVWQEDRDADDKWVRRKDLEGPMDESWNRGVRTIDTPDDGEDF